MKLDLSSRIGDITDAIRLHGSKRSDGCYILSVRHLGIIIDGRISEEYEDLPSFAPCQIDYIAVEPSGTSPWFNMFTAFSTHFPLMSNDKYAIGAAGEEAISTIYQYIQGFGETEDKERLREVRRSRWIDIVDKLTERTYLKGIDGDYGCDIHHAVDCRYCCYGDSKFNIQDIEKHILETIGKTEAFFIRVLYPKYNDLYNSGYLAFQTSERAARWENIIPKINDKVNSLISKKEVYELIEQKPEDILVKGRLKGDKKPRVTKPKKLINPSILSHPDFGTHPDNNASLDERIEYRNRFENKVREKIDKLGTTRFELIIPNDDLRKAFELQIQVVVEKYNDHYDSPSSASFYNGTTDICLPFIGAEVIDHYDEDKTPYLLGDVVGIFNSGRNTDETTALFFRIKTPKKERIVSFDFISGWYDDWNGIGKSPLVDVAMKIIKKTKLNSPTSKRTGQSYLRKDAEARIDNHSIKNMWYDYEKEKEEA